MEELYKREFMERESIILEEVVRSWDLCRLKMRWVESTGCPVGAEINWFILDKMWKSNKTRVLVLLFFN